MALPPSQESGSTSPAEKIARRIGEEILRICGRSAGEGVIRLVIVSLPRGSASLLEISSEGGIVVKPFVSSPEALKEEVLGKRALVLYLDERAFESLAEGRSSLVEELAKGGIRAVGRVDYLLC